MKRLTETGPHKTRRKQGKRRGSAVDIVSKESADAAGRRDRLILERAPAVRSRERERERARRRLVPRLPEVLRSEETTPSSLFTTGEPGRKKRWRAASDEKQDDDDEAKNKHGRLSKTPRAVAGRRVSPVAPAPRIRAQSPVFIAANRRMCSLGRVVFFPSLPR